MWNVDDVLPAICEIKRNCILQQLERSISQCFFLCRMTGIDVVLLDGCGFAYGTNELYGHVLRTLHYALHNSTPKQH